MLDSASANDKIEKKIITSANIGIMTKSVPRGQIAILRLLQKDYLDL